MKPTKSILEVRFSSPARQFNFLTDIVRAFGGSEPQNRDFSVDARNVRLQIRNEKSSLHFNANKYAINIEDKFDLDETRKRFLDLSKKLSVHIRWTNMTRIGFRTIWTLKVESFEDLVQKTKKNTI